MKEKTKKTANKDTVSQEELKAGVKTFGAEDKPHPALETPDGKNNGAEPAIFKHQQKWHP
jgi:hypothetical protein